MQDSAALRHGPGDTTGDGQIGGWGGTPRGLMAPLVIKSEARGFEVLPGVHYHILTLRLPSLSKVTLPTLGTCTSPSRPLSVSAGRGGTRPSDGIPGEDRTRQSEDEERNETALVSPRQREKRERSWQQSRPSGLAKRPNRRQRRSRKSAQTSGRPKEEAASLRRSRLAYSGHLSSPFISLSEVVNTVTCSLTLPTWPL